MTAPEERPTEHAQPGGDGPNPRYANYVLAVLFVVYVSNFIDRQILTILVQPIKEEFGVSDTAMGFLTGFAFAAFYTVAGLPIARWADVGVRRSIIAIGLTVWSTMTAVSGFAQTFFQLALARIGVGVGEAACSPPAHSLISDYFPAERRATALAIYAMGIYIGVMFGTLAGGWIKEFFGWRMAFLVVGFPGLILALIVRFTIREPERGATESVPVDDKTESIGDVARFLLARPTFIYLSLAASLHAFAGYGFSTWIPTFLVRVHDVSYGWIGTWVGLVTGMGGIIGALLGGRLVDSMSKNDPRWGAWIPGIATMLGLPFIFPFLLISVPEQAMVAYFGAVIFGAVYLGPTFAITQALVRVRMRAVAAAILLFVVNMIGLGAGPQVVGILNDVLAPTYGPEAVRYSLMMVGATNLVSGVLYVLAGRHMKADLARVSE